MPCIFKNEEDRDLVCHSPNGRERCGGSETEVLSHRMEEPEIQVSFPVLVGRRIDNRGYINVHLPDLRKFDGDVTKKDEFRAVPLFLCRWDFVL